jgi:hypothetical protein
VVRIPPPEEKGDPHLRSLREVVGYRVLAGEREIGSVADLQIDEQQVRLAAFVLEDRGMVAPETVTDIDWATQTVKVRHR